MVLDGESLKDVLLKVDGEKAEVTLKVKEIIYIRILEGIRVALDKIGRIRK